MHRSSAWGWLVVALFLLPAVVPGAAADDELAAVCVRQGPPPDVQANENCGPLQVILRVTTPEGSQEYDLGPCHENCDLIVVVDVILCHASRMYDIPWMFVHGQFGPVNWIENEAQKLLAVSGPLTPLILYAPALPGECLLPPTPMIR
jgi:hypothetical protein